MSSESSYSKRSLIILITIRHSAFQAVVKHCALSTKATARVYTGLAKSAGYTQNLNFHKICNFWVISLPLLSALSAARRWQCAKCKPRAKITIFGVWQEIWKLLKGTRPSNLTSLLSGFFELGWSGLHYFQRPSAPSNKLIITEQKWGWSDFIELFS